MFTTPSISRLAGMLRYAATHNTDTSRLFRAFVDELAPFHGERSAADVQGSSNESRNPSQGASSKTEDTEDSSLSRDGDANADSNMNGGGVADADSNMNGGGDESTTEGKEQEPCVPPMPAALERWGFVELPLQLRQVVGNLCATRLREPRCKPFLVLNNRSFTPPDHNAIKSVHLCVRLCK